MLRSLLPRITRIASPNIPTRGLHASALRPAMNIAQHDIFDAMGIRTDPAIARPIDRVDSDGFGVAGISVKGPVVVLGGKVFLWDVPQFGSAKTEGGVEGPGLFEGWNEEMLAVFEVLESPPEIVVFGTGAEFSPLPNLLRSKLHKLGIQVEIQKTRTAASTYNVLISEGRQAAAALLPIVPTSARTGQRLDVFAKAP